MRIILVDRQKPIVMAWVEAFRSQLDISIIHGSIFDVNCDAIVSPANSFGFMDGNLDYYISTYLGWHVQEKLQKTIKDKHHGELLVGQAEIVETGHKKIPYLISAPTMRVPMILRKSVNVYLATRAALLVATENKAIETIAIPGMGTGAGQTSPNICAKQMKRAYDSVFSTGPEFPTTWRQAQKEHYGLATLSGTDICAHCKKEIPKLHGYMSTNNGDKYHQKCIVNLEVKYQHLIYREKLSKS